jgi:hypothetical protein
MLHTLFVVEMHWQGARPAGGSTTLLWCAREATSSSCCVAFIPAVALGPCSAVRVSSYARLMRAQITTQHSLCVDGGLVAAGYVGVYQLTETVVLVARAAAHALLCAAAGCVP